ncbi:glycine--tRNA ligase [Candidatus Neomarinimicrobiota bacterium]
MDIKSIEKIVSLSKRRGFIFQSSEIYGGLASTWDYGPLGVEMKNNIKNLWWQDIVTSRRNVVGMDAAILMHPEVWEASGHIKNFHDPLVDNKKTKKRYRLDHLLLKQKQSVINDLGKVGLVPETIKEEQIITIINNLLGSFADNAGWYLQHCGVIDPVDGKVGDWTNPRQFNLMLKTSLGAVAESENVTYFRPETAQGIFVNFSNVVTTARQKLPFGIAQLGKAFRNEITTGNFLFRTREFEQMELEFFIYPDDAKEQLKYWSLERLNWYKKLGVREDKLRLRPHGKDELAHYSTACYDIEYEFPFGWSELEGIADRGTYDLDQHNKHAQKKQTYFDQVNNQHIVPSVIEVSAGVDRAFLTCLVDAYTEEEVNGEQRIVLKLSPKVAPITCAVFPLVNKNGLPEISENIFTEIQTEFSAFFDQGGSIGRRYRRQDEAGTPFGITIDHQTLADNTVTLRDRDTMEQIRIPADQALRELRKKLQ